MVIPKMIIGEVNWTNISSDWPGFILSGYDYIFQNWTYPLMFLGIIGYVYCINRSAMSAAAAICFMFAIYGVTGIFSYPEVAGYSLLNWIIVIVSFSGLFTTLFISIGKNKRGV